jgi:uncharacterized membrane protein
MRLRKEITELLDAGIIDQVTANRINEYYDNKSGTPQSKLLIVFGIFGSLLIGLGIILILAHNWDDLSRSAKTVIAFLPLILGQAICGYTLFKKPNSTAWREASSAFLFIAIGACISLISQIYNISGSMGAFMLTWMLLALPVIYVMRSSVASLFYIAGITWFACEVGYWDRTGENYLYWGLLLLVLPHYYLLYKNKRESNFFTFHNWFIPLSVIISLGTIATETEELMFIAYMSLFGLLYLIGNTPVLREQKIRNNGYLVLGSLGTVVLLLGLSFDFFWSDLRQEEFVTKDWIQTPEFIAAAILTLAALILLLYQKSKQRPFELKPVEGVFIFFIIIFLIGIKSPMAIVLINILVLMIGIMTIREGARQYNLGVLNYGLMIVTALVICRFFDTDLGFVLKGILFVGVGIGFFFANYMMIKRKKDLITPAGSTEAAGMKENNNP